MIPNHPHSPTPGFSIPKLQQDQLFWYPPLFFLSVCYLTHSQLHYYSPKWFCAPVFHQDIGNLYALLARASHLQHPHKKPAYKKEGCIFTQVTHKPIHFELCICSEQGGGGSCLSK